MTSPLPFNVKGERSTQPPSRPDRALCRWKTTFSSASISAIRVQSVGVCFLISLFSKYVYIALSDVIDTRLCQRTRHLLPFQILFEDERCNPNPRPHPPRSPPSALCANELFISVFQHILNSKLGEYVHVAFLDVIDTRLSHDFLKAESFEPAIVETPVGRLELCGPVTVNPPKTEDVTWIRDRTAFLYLTMQLSLFVFLPPQISPLNFRLPVPSSATLRPSSNPNAPTRWSHYLNFVLSKRSEASRHE